MDVITAILSDQAVRSITGIALLCAIADAITGILGYIRAGQFDASKLAEFLDTHFLKRVVPIILTAALGAGLTASSTASGGTVPPEISAIAGAATLAAWGMLIAYAYETLGSLGVPLPGTQSQSNNVQMIIKGADAAPPAG